MAIEQRKIRIFHQFLFFGLVFSLLVQERLKKSFARKKACFSTNLTELNSFFVFHACTKAKIWAFFANVLQSFSLALFFSFAFLVYQQFCCPLYHPCFAWNCGWLTFQGRGKLIFREQYVISETGSGFFPKMLPFLVSVTLTGLVVSKMRYRWNDLSLKLLLFINLYPASRGPSIFLDKSGTLKRSVA